MTGRDTVDDATLVIRARVGDREAFGALVRRHLRSAYAVARATVGDDADAEDVVQEAFLEALVHLERCRRPERFAAWLMQIVRNRGHNRRRYLRRRAADPLEEDAAPAPSSEDPARNVERAELRERLVAGLSTLPETQRRVVLLFDWEGRSHSEVAVALGISEGSSRLLLHRARGHLRRVLSDSHDRKVP